jgi:hypothetical protein
MSLKYLRSLAYVAIVVISIGCSSNRGASNPDHLIASGSTDTASTPSEPKTTEEERFIERQKKELEKQAQEIEDLKRQKFHDDYLRTRYLKEGTDGKPSRDGVGGY